MAKSRLYADSGDDSQHSNHGPSAGVGGRRRTCPGNGTPTDPRPEDLTMRTRTRISISAPRMANAMPTESASTMAMKDIGRSEDSNNYT
jgi:hypothetical protein